MHEKFVSYFSKISPLSSDESEAIIKSMQTKAFKKGEEGQISANHNWVCIEDTKLVVANEQQTQELFKYFPRLETISRAVMEAAFTEQKEALTQT